MLVMVKVVITQFFILLLFIFTIFSKKNFDNKKMMKKIKK